MLLKPFFIFKVTVCKEKKKKLFDRSLPDFFTDRFKKKIKILSIEKILNEVFEKLLFRGTEVSV